ncbi:MAG: IS110 family transposase [Gammaproteobacteria bacterium]|nr:IS110 family transposase [Gammaproteobacteria bacterium]NIR83742.1 IS110 family transposase [Gammaproteobacteria bacterium]NIR92026.1 IS110 family transposase [Gammaproteobacteria bacterium]NIU05045.1 IS110 family transposase [Gammaproteobacteria bacterium]NIX86319.1 IS110 family transposase [Gammaproteobacteria bacterium]
MNVAGIDAHATYLVVAIVSKAGDLLHAPMRITNKNASKLLALLERFRPIEAVVETSPAWPWLYDMLTGHGFGFVLAHAKRLRIIAESNYKRDEIDAELLARMRLAGLIPYVHPKDIETREQATLIRHRERLTRLRTGAASRIHAELHSVGLYLGRGRLLTRAGRRWVREHAWPVFGPEQQRLVRTHWVLIRTLSSMIQRLDRRIERVGAELPAVALLRTIPGIGPYRGLLIATEVLPIERFSTPAKLVGYAGLAPRSARSGLRPTRTGHIPAGANRRLRNAFVQGVVSHLKHAPDSWLSRYYEAHKKRLGWQTARVATARKLARATHAMLRTGEVWRDESDTPSGERSELQGTHVAPTTSVS